METPMATAYWQTRHQTAGTGWLDHYWNDLAASHRTVLLGELTRLPSFRSLVELGCHVGPNLRLIRQTFPTVSLRGIDVNPAVIDFTAESFRDDSMTRFVCADFATHILTWPECSVDVVLTCYALAYLEPPALRLVLAALVRVARIALVLAEPMAGWGESPGLVPRLPYPEWRHDYLRLVRELTTLSVRPVRFFGAVVSPPADRLDGILTCQFTGDQAVPAIDEVALRRQAATRCPLCRTGTPHHTNGIEGIGDPPHRRRPVPDLHSVDDVGGVGLQECLAGELWADYYRAGGKDGPGWR